MASQPALTARPKLIVFDLDNTLWPFWVDTHVRPPFCKRNGKIFDARQEEIASFPEVSAVLEWLHSEGYIMAAASKSREPEGAKQLIGLFGWEKYMKVMEIYPGCKTVHFDQIHNQSKIPFSDMLFFDDVKSNIRDVTQLGVVSKLVSKRTGVTMEVVRKGLSEYARKRQRRPWLEK